MHVLPAPRVVRRARARMARRAYAVFALTTFCFVTVLAGHYVLGWW